MDGLKKFSGKTFHSFIKSYWRNVPINLVLAKASLGNSLKKKITTICSRKSRGNPIKNTKKIIDKEPRVFQPEIYWGNTPIDFERVIEKTPQFLSTAIFEWVNSHKSHKRKIYIEKTSAILPKIYSRNTPINFKKSLTKIINNFAYQLFYGEKRLKNNFFW